LTCIVPVPGGEAIGSPIFPATIAEAADRTLIGAENGLFAMDPNGVLAAVPFDGEGELGSVTSIVNSYDNTLVRTTKGLFRLDNSGKLSLIENGRVAISSPFLGPAIVSTRGQTLVETVKGLFKIDATGRLVLVPGGEAVAGFLCRRS
jgi:hypothetical protein